MTLPSEVELLEIQLRAVLGDTPVEQLLANLRKMHPGVRARADAMLAELKRLT